MTYTADTAADRDDRSPTEESKAAEDEPMVIFEFAIPAESFVLEDVLREFPDVIVELERLVPTNHSPMPYLWTTDGKTPRFQTSMADDPRVDRLNKVTTFDEGALYHVEWAENGGELFHWIANTQNDISLLQAEGNDDEWILKLRFPSRALLADFRAFYNERGIDLRVIRLYDLTDPKLGQYNVSRKQREALVRALEMGHFEIPRETTLEEIAASLDISPKALSERLRRGQTNVLSNSLTIGQPTGVGVGEQ